MIRQAKNVGSWSLVLLGSTCLRISITEVGEKGYLFTTNHCFGMGERRYILSYMLPCLACRHSRL